MIYWLLRKLGLMASPTEAADAPDEDFIFVAAPIVRKAANPQFTLLTQTFTGETTVEELKPTFVRRPILNNGNKEFIAKLEKIIGSPPVNQTSPTKSDIEPQAPKKKKDFQHLKPLDASPGNRNAFSEVLSQIRKNNKDEEKTAEIEPAATESKSSAAYVSNRLGIKHMLLQMKSDHFSEPYSEHRCIEEPIVEGLDAPRAPPLLIVEDMLLGEEAPTAPVLR